MGRLGRAHGVRGEIRVEVETDFPELRFGPGQELLIGRPGDRDMTSVTVASVRPHKQWLLVRFEETSARELAQQMTGSNVYIPAEDLAELEADEYYVHDLIGLHVVTADNEPLGEVSQFIETGAADVLVIRGPDKERLIPMIGDVVQSVDLAAGVMVITPLPGMWE